MIGRRLNKAASDAALFTRSCRSTHRKSKSNSVDLIVTSPPFLDVVDYATDNWLRCWFNGIDEAKIDIWTFRKPSEWAAAMERVFGELRRVLNQGGYIAFEVGEVRRGKLRDGRARDSSSEGCEVESNSCLNKQSGVHKNVELLGRNESNCRDEHEPRDLASEVRMKPRGGEGAALLHRGFLGGLFPLPMSAPPPDIWPCAPPRTRAQRCGRSVFTKTAAPASLDQLATTRGLPP